MIPMAPLTTWERTAGRALFSDLQNQATLAVFGRLVPIDEAEKEQMRLPPDR